MLAAAQLKQQPPPGEKLNIEEGRCWADIWRMRAPDYWNPGRLRLLLICARLSARLHRLDREMAAMDFQATVTGKNGGLYQHPAIAIRAQVQAQLLAAMRAAGVAAQGDQRTTANHANRVEDKRAQVAGKQDNGLIPGLGGMPPAGRTMKPGGPAGWQ